MVSSFSSIKFASTPFGPAVFAKNPAFIAVENTTEFLFHKIDPFQDSKVSQIITTNANLFWYICRPIYKQQLDRLRRVSEGWFPRTTSVRTNLLNAEAEHHNTYPNSCSDDRPEIRITTKYVFAYCSVYDSAKNERECVTVQ